LRNKLIKILAVMTMILVLLPLNQAFAASSFIWPVDGGTVTTEFGNDILNGETRYHRGLDIAKAGTVPIKASAKGKVIYAQYHTGSSPERSYGNMVIIQHTVDGKVYETKYAHLKSISVRVNNTVNQGDMIGYMGNTGYSFGQHLHFEIRNGAGQALNPRDFLGKTVVSEPIYEVVGRMGDKTAKHIAFADTMEEATKFMNQYNNTSIIDLRNGREVKNDGVVRDIKVYHGSQTASGVNYYASFSTITKAEDFMSKYQNMVMVDTSTWEQIDWNVSNSKKYGAFNGSNGDRGDYGVQNAAIDYLESNYTNGVVLDKTYSYPKVVWNSNDDLPNKYFVTNGVLEARYPIYTAAVYARDSVANSTLTIE
jgi:hypothetical protein